MIDQVLMLTPRQAAKIIGCHPATVRLMAANGDIVADKQPTESNRHGYEWLIPRREAERIRDNPHKTSDGKSLGRPRGAKNKETKCLKSM